MELNYEKLAEPFKPNEIKILLVGEAPPPNGKKYFYQVPEKYTPSKTIKEDTSLPATIFNHFFNRRPISSIEYMDFLNQLKTKGVFLIDMINEPLKIRDREAKNGINQENLERLFSEENLTVFKEKVEKLITNETDIIFLLARNYRKAYKDKLKNNFSSVKFIRWKDFRLEKNKVEAEKK